MAPAYDWASVPGEAGSPLAHDRNSNLQVDPGEGIPNTRVVLKTHRENGAMIAEMISDAEGFVHLDQIPPGDHWAFVEGPWKFPYEDGNYVDASAGRPARCFSFVVPELSSPGGDVSSGGTRGALAKTGASVLGLAGLAVLLIAFDLGARAAGRNKETTPRVTP